ncbi:F0F1 ATP synthase subunit delta [Paenibacillus alvei]|uniref:ATP synthase subunit delta n=1 Tax=Paenibacillus alvei TaxID=44250 RepID=A0AAP6ZZV1_PAEAL|nr:MULTISPECIES: F0F1 ATP synthase subunit delta [Paenibacillus]EJW18467.1 ATP synthase subunit delta [Paenibacillus alvei DSM 29]MCY7485197.1 F0F1 ATP synthase subunit delta [Paenibacillus alvei]MCY9539634.1 F0F1 ATP synthase subunit delta [Paenibacillus alvei]MCY9703157.1 F0F1 ATP synthase subunit delta [Paenibacillus alvei]MCY9735623.1 F0F1 ATP synthase subunit delta [Paenibacillus alvei]
MSQNIVIAKRYAKALFELAQERQLVSETEQQLKETAELVKANHELYLILTSPNIGHAEKSAVLGKVLDGHVSDILLNMVQLLIERGRIDALREIADSYVRIAGEALGILDATVTSAYPLDESEKEAVAAEFGQKLGKTIRVHNVVDASVIGGLQVRIRDHLYDGSLSGKLERLNRSLKLQAQ